MANVAMMIQMLLFLSCVAGGCRTNDGAPPNQRNAVPLLLRLRLSDRNVTSTGEVATTAILENRGRETLVFALTRFNLVVDGPGARYVPNPGPPIPLWPLQGLKTGEKLSHEFNRGLNDEYGIWHLEPGQYTVRVGYRFTLDDADVIRRAGKEGAIAIPEGRVWVGEVMSEPETLVVMADKR